MTQQLLFMILSGVFLVMTITLMSSLRRTNRKIAEYRDVILSKEDTYASLYKMYDEQGRALERANNLRIEAEKKYLNLDTSNRELNTSLIDSEKELQLVKNSLKNINHLYRDLLEANAKEKATRVAPYTPKDCTVSPGIIARTAEANKGSDGDIDKTVTSSNSKPVTKSIKK